MEFIIQNWYIALALIALGVVGTLTVQRFWTLPLSAKLDIVRNWLVWAVTRAERELGSGTGPAKLRYVYDLMAQRLPWATLIIPFETFKAMVDEALVIMREMAEKNPAIAAAIIPTEAVTTKEIA
jgi:hypothetical protein